MVSSNIFSNKTLKVKSTPPSLTLWTYGGLLIKQSPDEVLGLGGDLRECLLSKFPVTAGDVLKGLQVVFSSEGGQPTQPVQQSIEIAHYSMI